MKGSLRCLLILLLSGCAPAAAFLPSGSQVVGISARASDLGRDAVACETNKATRIRLTEAGRFTRISGLDSADLDCTTIIEADLPLSGWKGELETGQVGIGDFDGYGVLHYTDRRIVLQALSLAFKFRSEVSGEDAFPSTVETGFNPAFALGYQYRRNRYSLQKNAFGNNTMSLGLTGGLFAGVSAVGLKSANTSGADIGVDRSVPAASTGVFALLGFDRVNMGLSIGFDRAFGDRADDWIYQGEPWYGVSVGLDLVK